MSPVDFRMEVTPDGPGTSTPGKDIWVFNPSNEDLAGIALLMTAEVHCAAGLAPFRNGSSYEMRIQALPLPPQGIRPVVASFGFRVATMEEEEEGWNRFKVELEAADKELLELSRIVLWFSDEHEPPPDLDDPQSYNLEEISRFTRRRMPPFVSGEVVTSFLEISG
jgi:hypothetical protein